MDIFQAKIKNIARKELFLRILQKIRKILLLKRKKSKRKHQRMTVKMMVCHTLKWH